MAAGSHRVVVGAHYGLRDWLIQRGTAVVLLGYLVLLAVRVAMAGPIDYEAWASIFAPAGMKVATLIAYIALAYHAWIGMRDIWMDYVRPTGIRLVLHLGTILWLFACLFWAVQILWKV
jgi:succinate dehydrogenase / fumarate reductase, membrane anchor subunit